MGLRGNLSSHNMAAMLLVVLLAIASTCQGAALPDRVKRDAMAGKLDRSFDLFGVHMVLKYKDAANPLKGWNLHIKGDDLKALFKKVDVNIDFDGGDSTQDGNFKLLVDYFMVHSDGAVSEKGQFLLENLSVSDDIGGGYPFYHTSVLKTSGFHFGGKPIIPAAISNMEVKVETDGETQLKFKYVNPTMERDIHFCFTKVRGDTGTPVSWHGKSFRIEIINGARKHDLKFGDDSYQDFNLMSGVFNIPVKGTSLGDPVKGFIKGDKNDKGHSIQVNLEKGNHKLLQLDSKIRVDIAAMKIEAKTKYALLGKISGSVITKFDQGTFTLKNTDQDKNTMELTITAMPGQSLSIEGKKNGISMWTYKTNRTNKHAGGVFEMNSDTKMTINSASQIATFLRTNYPDAAFNTRHNKFHVFVDKNNWNKLAPKFKIEVHLERDGVKAMGLILDTTTSPYKFHLDAPNIFKRWGISQPSIDVTVAHQIGSSLIIDTNILGGLHLEAKRGGNAKGGRDVSVLVKKGGVQMFKLTISTEKIDNANEFKFILHDTFDVNTESVLYKNLISKYKFLTPFTSRTGELEFYINKQERNVLLSKFYLKGKVMKDGAKAVELLLTTNEKPYKIELYAPALLKHIKTGMTEAKISVEHNPGQLLSVVTNFEKFKGFKISKTGSGNQREIEVNGKKLVTGEYTLTDNSFSTKITRGSDWIDPKITWEGKLPNSQAEAEAFLLKNNIQVHVTGSKWILDVSLNWEMTKPDFNLGTPENGKLSLNAKGRNPRWGDYSLSRDLNWSIANKAAEVNLTGKFMKKVNGKEYSIDFPQGSGAMPRIIMGQ